VENQIETVRQLGAVANDLGCTTAQLALAWCLQNPHVSSVITGASKPEQVEENMKALAVTDALDEERMARIESIFDNKPSPRPNHRE